MVLYRDQYNPAGIDPSVDIMVLLVVVLRWQLVVAEWSWLLAGRLCACLRPLFGLCSPPRVDCLVLVRVNGCVFGRTLHNVRCFRVISSWRHPMPMLGGGVGGYQGADDE